jgi:hypothetical protein
MSHSHIGYDSQATLTTGVSTAREKVWQESGRSRFW